MQQATEIIAKARHLTRRDEFVVIGKSSWSEEHGHPPYFTRRSDEYGNSQFSGHYDMTEDEAWIDFQERMQS